MRSATWRPSVASPTRASITSTSTRSGPTRKGSFASTSARSCHTSPDEVPMSTLRLAAVGDLHCKRSSAGAFRPLFARAAELADILCLCGDLADYGLPEEAHILVNEFGPAREMPIIAVLGNHDYEAGAQDEIRRILGDAGCTVLDGDACEVRGVGFAGVKGFIGGFGERMLGAWGESTIK